MRYSKTIAFVILSLFVAYIYGLFFWAYQLDRGELSEEIVIRWYVAGAVFAILFPIRKTWMHSFFQAWEVETYVRAFVGMMVPLLCAYLTKHFWLFLIVTDWEILQGVKKVMAAIKLDTPSGIFFTVTPIVVYSIVHWHSIPNFYAAPLIPQAPVTLAQPPVETGKFTEESGLEQFNVRKKIAED